MSVSNLRSGNERFSLFKDFANGFSARHFADAGMARIVGEDDNVARKVRCVCAAQVEQHAVEAGNGNDLHACDARSIRMHSA